MTEGLLGTSHRGFLQTAWNSGVLNVASPPTQYWAENQEVHEGHHGRKVVPKLVPSRVSRMDLGAWLGSHWRW